MKTRERKEGIKKGDNGKGTKKIDIKGRNIGRGRHEKKGREARIKIRGRKERIEKGDNWKGVYIKEINKGNGGSGSKRRLDTIEGKQMKRRN